MTIGKYGHDPSSGINPDFVTLMNSHNDICVNFAKSPADVHVSMGMSDDFEQAVSKYLTYSLNSWLVSICLMFYFYITMSFSTLYSLL